MSIQDINSGICILSKYKKDRPTLIGGLGRGGTSAVAKAFAHSGAKFSPLLKGGSYRSWESPYALTAVTHGHPIVFSRWMSEEDRRHKCSDWVTKVPVAERHIANNNEKMNMWDGNFIIVTRDILAGALRELLVVNSTADPVDTILYRNGIAMQSISAAALLSRKNHGVILVSYEKLILHPARVLGDIFDWMGKRDDLNLDAAAASVVPDNETYRQIPPPAVR